MFFCGFESFTSIETKGESGNNIISVLYFHDISRSMGFILLNGIGNGVCPQTTG